MKATASVILYKSKTLANDEHPIMLRICYNGKRTWKIQCKLPPKTKRFCPLVLK
ncbi:Arm DNA-binding domain-containing protein [Bacteroides intestinalis]|uniref:Arm DNA-binding domain-containing protein n=1 Tax=Bacteroides intestinalis TaxID=329854 RepID=UPI0032C0236A